MDDTILTHATMVNAAKPSHFERLTVVLMVRLYLRFPAYFAGSLGQLSRPNRVGRRIPGANLLLVAFAVVALLGSHVLAVILRPFILVGAVLLRVVTLPLSRSFVASLKLALAPFAGLAAIPSSTVHTEGV